VYRGVAVRLIADTGDRACLAYWYGVTDAPAAVRSAAYAAREDPRYRPIEESEIPELKLELSVFGKFVPARDPFDFQSGTETLMVVKKGDPTLIQAGVMTDLQMSKLGYVRALCRKAGWKRMPEIRGSPLVPRADGQGCPSRRGGGRYMKEKK